MKTHKLHTAEEIQEVEKYMEKWEAQGVTFVYEGDDIKCDDVDGILKKTDMREITKNKAKIAWLLLEKKKATMIANASREVFNLYPKNFIEWIKKHKPKRWVNLEILHDAMNDPDSTLEEHEHNVYGWKFGWKHTIEEFEKEAVDGHTA